MTNTEYFKTIQTNSETSSTSGELTILSKTLLIFDFDDTLFCTKYLDTFALSYQEIFTCKISLEQLNPCLALEIKKLETAILDLFINLSQFYDIVFISNADLKWINNCLTHFLPEFKDFLDENEIKIHSAKNIFSKIVKSPVDWKLKCFKKVMTDLYGDDAYYDLNVVSIGDGNEEKKAVFSLTKGLKNRKIRTKFIKMISFPSAASIILQLKYLNDNLNNMVLNEDSIYKMSIKLKNNNVEIEKMDGMENIEILQTKIKNIENEIMSKLNVFLKKIKKVKKLGKKII